VRILAIETTALSGSLALLEDDLVVSEAHLPEEMRSAQSLAPSIESLLNDRAWPIASLQLIAVVQGPGSFTGVRVGITTAKTLAYALSCEVMGIDTLDVLASQAAPAAARIHPIVDAQRGQLFTAQFTWPNGEPFAVRKSATAIVDLTPWLAGLHPGDVVIGPALGKISPQLPELLLSQNRVQCEASAAIAGRLAWRNFQAGRRDSLWTLAPHYHRLSAAEENRAAAIRPATL
jgi:tRNA threonylcarbamoyladenosine biosynthesis protein TsaB